MPKEPNYFEVARDAIQAKAKEFAASQPPSQVNALFASGALTSSSPRFDLIPRQALVRLARRYEKGLVRYGKDNWRKGLADPDYVLERLAHAVGHLYALMDQIEGRLPWSDDDHAAALMWAAAFACEATEVLNAERQAKDTK